MDFFLCISKCAFGMQFIFSHVNLSAIVLLFYFIRHCNFNEFSFHYSYFDFEVFHSNNLKISFRLLMPIMTDCFILVINQFQFYHVVFNQVTTMLRSTALCAVAPLIYIYATKFSIVGYIMKDFHTLRRCNTPGLITC